ncbi:MAG: chitobiase/beta-hexosaminidase C-terminal domain-containing protein [Oscillospiraceae bacterium]
MNTGILSKRILPVLLSVALMFTMTPVTAFAAPVVAIVNNRSYTSIEKAWEVALNTGSGYPIFMQCDWNYDGRLVVPDGKHMEIYMNGYMINRHLASDNEKNSKNDGEVIQANKNSTLIIHGGNPSVLHKGYVSQNKVWYASNASYSGTVNYYGGVIAGGHSKNGAGGIHVKSGAIVTLDSVTIAGNIADMSGGMDGYGGGIMLDGENCRLTLTGTTRISHNYAQDDGGGIYINGSNARIYMDRTCSIDNNKSDDRGGAVYADKEKANIIGGQIFDNYSGSNGGAIYINADDALLKDLDIHNNFAAGSGGGVYVYQEDCEFYNCKINNNTANNGLGGGVYIYDDGTAMTNCEVTGNTAKGNGGGIYVCSTVDLSLNGKMVVKNNTTSSRRNNVYLDSLVDVGWRPVGATISYLTGALSAGSQVGLSGSFSLVSPNERLIYQEPGSFNENYYFSDDSQYGVYWDWMKGGSDSRDLKLKKGYTQPAPPAPDKISVQDRTQEVGTYNNYPLQKGVFTFSSVLDSTTDLDAVYYYSDGYFAADPAVYNDHLTTMSLCLAMSAFATNAGYAGTSYYDENGNAVSCPGEGDYTNRFAHVKQLLSDIGCNEEDIYISDTYTEKPGADTIGVAIAKKEISIDGNTCYLVPIAIRGAGYESEWSSNVTLGEQGEAGGFGSAAEQVLAQVDHFIANYDLSQALHEGRVIFWTAGFSRAGATSNLTSKGLTDKYGDKSGQQKPCKVFGFCFEAPQGGVDAVSTELYPNIHNIINKSDPVPMVGPSQMGFKRYGVDHYLPGSAAGVPTKDYALSESVNGLNPVIYYDNKNYKVGSSEYLKQRTEMLKHLQAVNPDIVFDDYFRLATMNPLTGGLSSFLNLHLVDLFDPVTKNGEVLAEEWLPQMIEELQEWAINGWKDKNQVSADYNKDEFRSAYTNTSAVKRFPSFSDSDESIQSSFKFLTELAFGKSSDELGNFAGNLTANGLENSGVFDLFSLIMLLYYQTGDDTWDTISTSGKDEWFQYMWNVINKKNSDTDLAKDLSPEELEKLHDVIPVLVDFLMRLIGTDAETESAEPNSSKENILLGTFGYNSGSIIQPHYPEVSLAWLRSYDSFYQNESRQVELVNKTAPEVPQSSEPSGQLLVSDSITLTSTPGAAIYYKLETNVTYEDGSTDRTQADWQLYKNGISLGLKGKTAEYKITAYAMQYGHKSAEKTFTYIVEKNSSLIVRNGMSDTPEVTPYNAGQTVSVIAEAVSGYEFKGWKEELSDGEQPIVPINSTDFSTSVLNFIMPDRSVSLTAEYRQVFNSVEIKLQSELADKQCFAVGESIYQTIPAENILLYDRSKPDQIGTPYGSSGDVDIKWYDSSKASINDTVFERGKTYIAAITLEPNETVCFAAGDISAEIAGIPVAVISNDDGSITLCGEIIPRVTDLKQVNWADFDGITADSENVFSYLPNKVEIETTDGGKYFCCVTWQETDQPNVFVAAAEIPDWIANPDNVELTKTVTIVIADADALPSPISDLPQGTYATEQKLSLTAGEAEIYYTLDGSEPTLSSELLPEGGFITLSGEQGQQKDYTIKAFAVSGEKQSSIVTFKYCISIPESYTLTVSYRDYVENGWQGDDQTIFCVKGELAVLQPVSEPDTQFICWLDENGEVISNNYTLVFRPQSDRHITAIYSPEVKEISVTFDEPQAGKPLASKVGICRIKITNEYYIDTNLFDLICWSPSDIRAVGGSNYQALLWIPSEDSTIIDGNCITSINTNDFIISDNCSITVNGNNRIKATVTNYPGSGILMNCSFSLPSTELIAISCPLCVFPRPNFSWFAMSRSARASSDFELPESLEVEVSDKSITSVGVDWDMSTSTYDPGNPSFQKITVTGNAELPQFVSDPNGIGDNITGVFYVEGLDRAEMPYANLESGTYSSEQTVVLNSSDSAARIYYTTDGSEPTEADTLYTEPITISSSQTIKAIAVADNMQNSYTAIYYYTIDSSSKPVIPSNPSSPGGGSVFEPLPSIGETEMTWTQIAEVIRKTGKSQTIIVNLNGLTEVPTEVIEATADVDATVEFVVFSAVSWIIIGADINDVHAADLMFARTTGQKSDGLRGMEGTQFKINNTGIPTSLEIAFKTEHAGKFANLYKVVDGTPVFVTCAKLGEDGKVILPDVTEKGDYVAMLCEFSDRLGDMDNDGVMNAKDASAILKDIVGLEPGKNPLMADFNGDGHINAMDAAAILKRIVGLA